MYIVGDTPAHHAARALVRRAGSLEGARDRCREHLTVYSAILGGGYGTVPRAGKREAARREHRHWRAVAALIGVGTHYDPR